MVGMDPWRSLGLAIAIVTLPFGLLSGMFLGFQVAAIVFIVGWFLLTPLLLIFGAEIVPSGVSVRGDERASGADGDDATDPRDELKRRYVRGEIDDGEFERRMREVIEADHDEAVTDWSGDGSSASDGSSLGGHDDDSSHGGHDDEWRGERSVE